MNNIINFAHRGASAVCPENTMAAFRKGLELGATGIETDVQMTKDGGIVLIHDETLNRTTSGTGYVKDHSLAELLEVDAGSWFGPEFKDERLPLLEDLLDLLQGRDTILNIELKNGTFLYPGMEEKVIAVSTGFQDERSRHFFELQPLFTSLLSVAGTGDQNRNSLRGRSVSSLGLCSYAWSDRVACVSFCGTA